MVVLERERQIRTLGLALRISGKPVVVTKQHLYKLLHAFENKNKQQTIIFQVQTA